MKKLIILLLTLHASLFTLQADAQSCLPEGITFTTQAEIDSFQSNYPGCTEIEGDVVIGEWPGSNITNLNGLNVLTSLGGSLDIRFNKSLDNLQGLQNLTAIGGDFGIYDNDTLTSLTGLEGLTSINGPFVIIGNDALCSLTGLANVTFVGGSLVLENNGSLAHLSGLNNLEAIGDDLRIGANGALVDLTGLEKLAFIDGGLWIGANGALVNLTGLEQLAFIGSDLCIGSYGINAIPGGLYCEGNGSLVDISALSNLTTIGGNLEIYCNDTLSNLNGLENLSTIGGSLIIGYAHEHDYFMQLAGNRSLTDITGLQGVSTIGSSIDIQGNALLTSLTGLENIDASSIEHLTIKHNESLSSCEIQSICDYLSNPGGVVNIYSNAPGCNNPPELADNCGIALPCLPFGNYHFLSQSSIDNFQDHYPGCSELGGDIIISGEDVTNLDSLGMITSIEGELVIYNTALPGLAGLEALNSIGGDLIIGGDPYFGSGGNPYLPNLSGLNGLNSVGGSLRIIDNDSMDSLSGIENLAYIGGWIVIEGNDDLESIAGLGNIVADSLTGIVITYNPSLSYCHVESVCDYMVIPLPYGSTFIHDNADGCKSKEEVREACIFGVAEPAVNNQQSIVRVFPNPASGMVDFQFSSFAFQRLTLKILDLHGREVAMLLDAVIMAGEHNVQFDLGQHPPGIYFYHLVSGKQTSTGKLVVMRQP